MIFKIAIFEQGLKIISTCHGENQVKKVHFIFELEVVDSNDKNIKMMECWCGISFGMLTRMLTNTTGTTYLKSR